MTKENLNTSNTFTFNRDERLKSKKLIASLFEKGSYFNSGTIQVKYMVVPEEMPYPAKAAFVVAKSKFKRAVDRNLLKRRMKEAYRLQKQSFYASLQAKEKKVLIIFMYGAKTENSFQQINGDMKKTLNKLKQRFEA